MRKIIYIAVAVLIVVIVLATVVGLYVTNRPGTSSGSQLKVLATFYPLYARATPTTPFSSSTILVCQNR